jgi:hypothetical protein
MIVSQYAGLWVGLVQFSVCPTVAFPPGEVQHHPQKSLLNRTFFAFRIAISGTFLKQLHCFG